MLEDLERIWMKETGATVDDVENLKKWMKNSNFPSQYLPTEYIQFLQECNGGIFTNGKREYQFLTTERTVG